MSLLEVKNLVVEFPNRRGTLRAIDNISFDIAPGEILGVVGASGSGKSVTGFSLIGLVDPPGRIMGGSILFDGQELVGLPASTMRALRGRRIAMVFQDPGATLNPVLTIGQQMVLAVRAHRAASLAEARALAAEPKLLLVDEVASGLSTVEIATFVKHIRDIRDHYGITVIWVEHIFSALAQVVDRLIVLDNGAVIADAPLAEAMRDEKVLTTYLGHAATEAK